MKRKSRTFFIGFLYIVALFSFLGAVTANSRGSMLDFSDIACVVFCGLAVVCVTAATLLWKAKTAKVKLIVILIAVAIIIGGGFLDKYLDHNTGTREYTDGMIKISEAVAAKFETADGRSVLVDGEIDLLRSMSELEIQQAPMTPADGPEDWIYRITFNPVEKVPMAKKSLSRFTKSTCKLRMNTICLMEMSILRVSFHGLMERQHTFSAEHANASWK